MVKIDRFTGRNAFLGNFYHDNIHRALEYDYQKAKTNDEIEKMLIDSAKSPAEAKQYGQMVTLRPDWESVKLDVMYALVKQKFSAEPFRTWLLETGNTELIEGNNHHDTYWGTVNGIGKNHLGKILMRVRSELRQ